MLRRLASPSISSIGKRALSTTPISKSSSEITVKEQRPYVYNVKLNRPAKLNTFTMEMWREFKKVIDGLAEDPKCRSIIVSGEGKSFCAGIDLAAGLSDIIRVIQDDSMEIGRKGRAVRRFIGEIQDCFTALEKCPKPIIAAVHSHCLGAGIDLITACDIRIATQDANFSIREVDIGLAADIGTLNRIQKVVGNDSWTREVALTARDFGADEAHRYGLISRIVDDRHSLNEKSIELAARIAEKSPIAVQGTKETLNYARDHSTDDSLNFIRTWNMSQLLSTDLMNSTMAAMNKKKATYEDV
uniref:Delta(3,5)-Delta(2,4)-dienoyl-CoA isomerase, mitochondrial n=1 Tax=Caenorhabditis tropicalis TaxID=1561998 RepID=A0A1I7UGU8_9PELO